MGLLGEIQNEAVDSKSDLGQLLRKCKVLAARLGNKPLEQWLIWESEGYPADVELPEYRRWAIGIKAHFAGPFQSGLHNVEVPPIAIPENFRDAFTRYECRDSVAVLQEMMASGSDGLFHCDTGNLVVILGGKVVSGMNCIQAWGEFSGSRVVQVLDTVRNRVLDFALALGKESPEAGEIGVVAAGYRRSASPRLSTQRYTQARRA